MRESIVKKFVVAMMILTLIIACVSSVIFDIANARAEEADSALYEEKNLHRNKS